MIKFDKDHELVKIREGFKLPIDNVEIGKGEQAGQAELFYKTKSVGWVIALPVPTHGGQIWKYDFSYLNGINWDPIYQDNVDILTKLVKDQVKDQSIALKKGATIGRLEIVVGDPKENLPRLFYSCAYEGEKWKVYPA